MNGRGAIDENPFSVSICFRAQSVKLLEAVTALRALLLARKAAYVAEFAAELAGLGHVPRGGA